MSANKHTSKSGLLMTANWDSNVGYAWWLMESFWVRLAEEYHGKLNPIVAYPSISTIPPLINASPIVSVLSDFSQLGFRTAWSQLGFIVQHDIKIIYMSDKPSRHWMYLLFRLAGVRKIIVHDHTPGLRSAPRGWKRTIKTLINRLPFITADACIGATGFLRQRFIDVACVPASRCYTAPNGIPLVAINPRSIHETFSIPVHRKVIVTAARANHYKGGLFALTVFAALKNNYPDLAWHYVFMGDGPHRDEFIATAKDFDLEGYVTFPGRVSQVAELFANADFAFHPSRGEVGYSLSILEYMWSGLPVIVPDNPSVSGATEDGKTGFIYAEGDVSEAVDVIVKCLKDPALTKTLGLSARESVRQNYSLAETHYQLINIFAAVIPDVERL